MCLPDGQGHSGGNGTPPKSRRDDQIRGDLPGVSIRTVISLVFSPHETVDDRLIEVPLSSPASIDPKSTLPAIRMVAIPSDTNPAEIYSAAG